MDPITFTVPGIAGPDLVVWAYERGMCGTVGGKAVRDKLFKAVRHKRCPLCGHGRVTQLDHTLPKSIFPALCVDPLNLVPACSDCNKLKGDRRPSTPETTPLHPYLDDIDGDAWLHARVVEGPPPTLEFFVEPPASWSPVLAARARHHFAMLDLGTAYGERANSTISSLRGILKDTLAAGGSTDVRQTLESLAGSYLAEQPNGWEGVTYRTLAADPAFCQGSFGD
ncbi:HNH endonuclease [Streptomyces erythrochromogenes]|uniref:HNH endonuclease n=1 Tax=Streptomyces erythrochromogenes TaxID=285574 RepID=UPI0036C3677C